MNTDSGFNHVRDSGVEPGSIGEDQYAQRCAQLGASESDVAAFAPVVEGESSPAANAAPTRRTRSRMIKPPIIEVVYVPTMFDPDEKKVVIDILADWILKDIEKEMKKKEIPKPDSFTTK